MQSFFCQKTRWNEIACKICFFYCVGARLYEGASYQLYEKMSKYTVSVKSILNVTKVRCTSTHQTSFAPTVIIVLSNKLYVESDNILRIFIKELQVFVDIWHWMKCIFNSQQVIIWSMVFFSEMFGNVWHWIKCISS